ncbi:hypothetical protein [Marinococcus sp. PL1-022]|uniref:hypothetical protein n=1 Tax=Marinococcus sp. PL1-022 TaxID=3095363 RepID=UPI0029C24E80|nr:hypothetical protein [Marinococcus sp. PL1-022]MDX6152815.1 hypothetical protein [Marinococcus sp. PL1-022]
MQEKRKWYRRILGYRSGSKWKATLASAFYLFLLFNIVGVIFVDEPAPTLEENASEEAIEAEKVEAEEERKVQEAKEQEKAEEQAAKEIEETEKQKAREEEQKAKEEKEQEEQKVKEQEAAEKQAAKEKEKKQENSDKSSSEMINDYVLDHSYGIMLDYEGVKDVHAAFDEDSKTISLAIVVESATNEDYAKDLADSFIRSLSSGASIYGNEDLESPDKNNLGELYNYYDLHVVVATSSEEYIIQGFKAKGSQSLVY